jgi:serine phosphatase RsbU (regulator of sigma subunit)/CHASE3 domain sensor protein
VVLLRRRLLLLFISVVLAVTVVGLLARWVIRARDDASAHGRTVRVAREQVGRLNAAYSDQAAGVNAFVATGADELSVLYRDGSRDATRVVKALRGVESSVPELRAPLDAVLAAEQRWRERVAAPAIALVDADELVAARSVIDSDTAARLSATLGQRLDALDRRVASVGRASDDRATTTRRQLTLLVVLVLVVVVLGMLLAAWLIRRWVTRPLDRLVADVRRVRAGDPGPIEATGPPEIAELATDIEAMRERIDEQRVTAERAREAVEQNAGVVLALRSQLEPEVGELPSGWTIAAQLRAAEGVAAGDCYDLVRLRGNRLGLIVVDIAGHGATEGILALRCKELLRASLAADVAPGDAVRAAAEQLGEMGPEVFLTAFVAVVDTTSGSVAYANAGHPPAFISAADGDVDLDPTGSLVGPLGSHWGTASATMEPGDNLCAYTDGLIEIRNADREFFGPERLRSLIRGSRCDQAAAIVQRCLDEAELFTAGRIHDDATIVVLCRPGQQPSAASSSEVRDVDRAAAPPHGGSFVRHGGGAR